MPTQTGVTTQTISSTKMALATAFLGVAAMAAAAAGMMTSGPDLVIDNLSAANGTDLSAGVYSFTLKNIGSRPAKGPFYISFEAIGEVNGTLSTLSLPTADFEANGMKIMKLKETNIMKGIVIQVPSYLKAGDSIVFSGGLTLPSNTQKVHVFADSYNRVKELDEVNNGTEYTLVLPNVICVDSDSGKNSSVKGVATHTFNSGLVVSYEDHCYTGNQNTVSVSSSDKLAEYYCGDDGYVTPSYNTTCEFGCFEGACIMTSSTYPVTPTTTASCTPYDTCNDNNPCTEDFCSPNTKACKNVPYPTSTAEYNCSGDGTVTSNYPLKGLIKGDKESKVWFVDNNKKYEFLNVKVFGTWYSDVSSISEKVQQVVDSLEKGGYVCPRAGSTIIKFTQDPQLYFPGDDCFLYPIVTQEWAEQWFGENWLEKVVDYPVTFKSEYIHKKKISTTALAYVTSTPSQFPHGATIQFGNEYWYITDDGKQHVYTDTSEELPNLIGSMNVADFGQFAQLVFAKMPVVPDDTYIDWISLPKQGLF